MVGQWGLHTRKRVALRYGDLVERLKYVAGANGSINMESYTGFINMELVGLTP
jgi:hypothetical protein